MGFINCRRFLSWNVLLAVTLAGAPLVWARQAGTEPSAAAAGNASAGQEEARGIAPSAAERTAPPAKDEASAPLQGPAFGRGAARAEAPAAAPGSGVESMALPLIKSVGGAGLVLCLILGCFLLFKKYAPQYLKKESSRKMLRMIETLPMGEKRSVAVVQAGSRTLLLGNTPGRITLLATLADTPAEDRPLPPKAEPKPKDAPHPASFRTIYEFEKKGLLNRPDGAAAIPPEIRGKMQELRRALEG